MTAPYVPILLVERGPLRGLAATRDEVKARLTPLFDVRAESAGERLDDVGPLTARVRALADAWSGEHPAFLDCRTGAGDERLRDGRVHLAHLLDEGRQRGLRLVPVTGLRRPAAYQLAVADAALTDGRGACLRVELGDVEAIESIEGRVDAFLETVALAPDVIDLVVDLGEIPHARLALLQVMARAVLAPLAGLAPWRSVTLAAAAAAPPDVDYARGAGRTIERTDWLLWRLLAADAAPRGLRFGDYGPWRRPIASGSGGRWLYYTHDAAWLLVDAAPPARLAATAVREGAGGVYRARLSRADDAPPLGELSRQPEFHGVAHCAGDACFVECSPNGRTDPSVWRAAATTHHLTTVVEQLTDAPHGLAD